jgi:FkbM family methyltransferase
MDYSQDGEQKVILDYFKDFKGRLLDIGANDGKTLSNSRALMECGWYGVLVEPSKTAFSKLYELYKDSKEANLVPYAISDKAEKVTFFESGTHLKQGDTSLLSTIKESELDRWKNSDNEFTETEVECITMQDLKELSSLESYDFITIDAKGVDFEILSQIDLTDTKLVCVETNSIEDKKYIDYCTQFGLKVIHKNYCNLILGR